MKTNSTSSYIELLKKTLIDYGRINTYEFHPLTIVEPNWKTAFLFPMDRLLRKRNFAIGKMKYVEAEKRMNGYDWPANADTMVGMNRLNHIEDCIHILLDDKIPGDLIETGVWRGGTTILMKAILRERDIKDRKVWVADSFQGLPKPDGKNYPEDKGNGLYRKKILSVGLEEVQRNFEKYDLLDDQVVFLKGWFKDTLPQAPIHHLALLRIDADMYESTMQVLIHLYPKLSPGGFVIVDDYHAFHYCKKAVDDYRTKHGITEPIINIDKEAIYWRKKD